MIDISDEFTGSDVSKLYKITWSNPSESDMDYWSNVIDEISKYINVVNVDTLYKKRPVYKKEKRTKEQHAIEKTLQEEAKRTGKAFVSPFRTLRDKVDAIKQYDENGNEEIQMAVRKRPMRDANGNYMYEPVYMDKFKQILSDERGPLMYHEVPVEVELHKDYPTQRQEKDAEGNETGALIFEDYLDEVYLWVSSIKDVALWCTYRSYSEIAIFESNNLMQIGTVDVKWFADGKKKVKKILSAKTTSGQHTTKFMRDTH